MASSSVRALKVVAAFRVLGEVEACFLIVRVDPEAGNARHLERNVGADQCPQNRDDRCNGLRLELRADNTFFVREIGIG